MLNVGVAGGRSVRWTVPCPGGQVEVANGEDAIGTAKSLSYSTASGRLSRHCLFDGASVNGILHRGHRRDARVRDACCKLPRA